MVLEWHRITLSGRYHTRFHAAKEPPNVHTLFTLAQGALCAVADISLVLIFTISTYVIISWHLITPIERDFSCSDPSLSHPLYPNTVPTSVLLALTLATPFSIIVVANYASVWGTTSAPSHLESIASILHQSTYVYLDYVVGFWVLTILLDAIKCAVGRLRPNFVHMCRPAACIPPDELIKYTITETSCTSDWKKARNSRMSFPSGHAAAAVFALFFMYYFLSQLYAKMPTKALRAFRYAIIAFYALFCVYCCLTRITDYWHHPTDVLGGSLIAIVIFQLFLRKYKQHRSGGGGGK